MRMTRRRKSKLYVWHVQIRSEVWDVISPLTRTPFKFRSSSLLLTTCDFKENSKRVLPQVPLVPEVHPIQLQVLGAEACLGLRAVPRLQEEQGGEKVGAMLRVPPQGGPPGDSGYRHQGCGFRWLK